MPKSVLRITFVTLSLILLLSLLLLPVLGKAEDVVRPIKQTAFPEISPLVSSQLTFTPVATIYLPLVLSSLTVTDGLAINIDLPGGDLYQVNDEIAIIITVASPVGVDSFVWGVFKNLTAITGGEIECNDETQCKIEVTFTAPIPGEFLVGVDGSDNEGNIESKSVEFLVE
jgi:hypothetical protein